MNGVIQAVLVLAILGAIFGVVLAVASKKLKVETDERVDQILAVLPGANCGACGYPGCAGYADAVVNHGAPLNGCVSATPEAVQTIGQIMGQEVDLTAVRKVAQLHCDGTCSNAQVKYNYHGIRDCHLAVTQFTGPNQCSFGCIGLGSCEQACPFDAIHMGEDGLPHVNTAQCTGCGVCVGQCPQKVLSLAPVNKRVHIRCSTRSKGKVAMDACSVACISCGLCVKACPSGAITMVENASGSVPVINYDLCTGCGACVAKCPRKCIHLDAPIDPELVPCEKPTAVESGCANCPLHGSCHSSD